MYSYLDIHTNNVYSRSLRDRVQTERKFSSFSRNYEERISLSRYVTYQICYSRLRAAKMHLKVELTGICIGHFYGDWKALRSACLSSRGRYSMFYSTKISRKAKVDESLQYLRWSQTSHLLEIQVINILNAVQATESNLKATKVQKIIYSNSHV